MQENNKYTDKKLQDLETHSLPDLSKMEDHWNDMQGMMTAPSYPKVGKPYLKIFIAALSVGLLTFLLIRFFGREDARPQAVQTTPVQSLVDTIPYDREARIVTNPRKDTVYLKAKTSDGKDIVLPALVVSDQTIPTQSRTRSRQTNHTGNVRQASRQRVNRQSSVVLKLAAYDTIAPPKQDLLLHLRKLPQTFLIDNTKDYVIQGKEGARLRIRAGSFESTATVRIELTEFFTKSDIIINQLPTTSGNQQLITGGMVRIDAYDKQRSIGLKKGRKITLELPCTKCDPDMLLFEGRGIAMSDAIGGRVIVDWMPTSSKFNATDTIIAVEEKRSEIRLFNTITDTISNTITVVSRDTSFATPTITFKNNRNLTVYSVDISNLGWINCDRFRLEPGPKCDLVVDLGESAYNYYTLIVFEKIRSVMVGEPQGNKVYFHNIPVGDSVHLVSIGTDNGQSVLAKTRLITSATTVTKLNFEETTTEKTRVALQELDK